MSRKMNSSGSLAFVAIELLKLEVFERQVNGLTGGASEMVPTPSGHGRAWALRGQIGKPSVVIAKFVTHLSRSLNELRDLNHTSNIMILVSLLFPKFAPATAAGGGELRNGTLVW